MKLKRKKKSRKYIILLILFILAVAVFVSNELKIFEKNPPIIDTQELIYLNLKDPIRIKISDEQSGLAYVKITLQKENNESSELLLEQTFNKETQSLLEVLLPKNTYKEQVHSYTLYIEAKDNSFWNFFSGNVATKELKIIVDEKKPKIDILSNSYQIQQGGAASVVFKASDENLAEVFIQTEQGKIFKVSPFVAEGYYASLIAWEAKENNFRAYVIAKDKAGNISKERIPFYLQNKKYKNSNIALTDRFLEGKIQSLVSQYAQNAQEFDKPKSFKFVNEDLRNANEELIYKISSELNTANVENFNLKLFLPLKNAMKVADFADHRFYSYNNNFVSDSYHMGLDLASTARAPIIVNNDGRVVFAEENGIYGINIIIDHGFGLYSLYGHCSSSEVSAGDEVKAGQVIAKTGTTGLALGDHLHFGILIQGVETRPEEWQDSNWIKNNISKILDEGKKIILSETK